MGEPGHKVVKVVLVVTAPYMGEVVAELVPTACGGNHIGIVVVINSIAVICELLREGNFFHESGLLSIRVMAGLPCLSVTVGSLRYTGIFRAVSLFTLKIRP